MTRSGKELLDAARTFAAELAEYITDCDEANELLRFADRAKGPIKWGPGRSLREELREARAREEGQ